MRQDCGDTRLTSRRSAVQYADYTLWQRALLGREEDPASPLALQIAYWTSQLADLPVELALPTDRPRPRTPSYAGGAVGIAIPAELHAKSCRPLPRAGRYAVHAAAGRAGCPAQQARWR